MDCDILVYFKHFLRARQQGIVELLMIDGINNSRCKRMKIDQFKRLIKVGLSLQVVLHDKHHKHKSQAVIGQIIVIEDYNTIYILFMSGLTVLVRGDP